MVVDDDRVPGAVAVEAHAVDADLRVVGDDQLPDEAAAVVGKRAERGEEVAGPGLARWVVEPFRRRLVYLIWKMTNGIYYAAFE